MNVAPEVVEIAAAAEQAKVSMSAVLERAQVAKTTWSRWTNGDFEPRVNTLRKVRQALNDEIAARVKAA